MELPSLVHPALGHQEMKVRVEIDAVAECLDDGNNSGLKVPPCDSREIADEGAEGRAAEFPQQPAVVLEEYPQQPGDGEDDLAMGDIEEKLLSHPPQYLDKIVRLGLAKESVQAISVVLVIFALSGSNPKRCLSIIKSKIKLEKGSCLGHIEKTRHLFCFIADTNIRYFFHALTLYLIQDYNLFPSRNRPYDFNNNLEVAYDLTYWPSKWILMISQ